MQWGISCFYDLFFLWGSWRMEFSLFCKTVSGSLSGLSVEQYTNIFESLIVAPMEPIMAIVIYGLTIGIVVFGIQTGLKSGVKF